MNLFGVGSELVREQLCIRIIFHYLRAHETGCIRAFLESPLMPRSHLYLYGYDLMRSCPITCPVVT